MCVNDVDADLALRAELTEAAKVLKDSRNRAKLSTFETTLLRENEETGEEEEIDIVVGYNFERGYPGTYWEPPQSDLFEIDSVWRQDDEDCEIELTAREEEKILDELYNSGCEDPRNYED